MAIDAEELIIQPFREVVERGKEAVNNAEAAVAAAAAVSDGTDQNTTEASQTLDATAMLRTARSLVKEGDRALQRLLPLWKERVDKYGDAFTESMRQNDRILDSQRRLEDLLYDLDDFVQFDSFDARKFAKVQAASKSFALTLLESIRRIHLDSSAAPSTSSIASWIQPQLSPRTLDNRSRTDNEAMMTPLGLNVNGGIGRSGTLTRRPSSPDILGAERDCISLVSEGSGSPPPTSRISAWVNEQTTATKSWPCSNSIPEDSYFVGPWITNNLDTLALRGPGLPKPPSIPYSPVTSNSRISWYTSTGSYVSGPRSSFNIPTSDQRTSSLAITAQSFPENQGSRDSQPTSAPIPLVYDDGLILADELFSTSKSSTCGYQIGLDSTLYQQKGLCPGALTFRVKGRKNATRAVQEYGTRRNVSRCTECEFVQNLLEFELDAAQDTSGNFKKSGVFYRLRFLYKSHLISDSAFTMHYGCLFCAQKGQTVYPDDATVFETQEQLFRHLARHPQPLPEIPGVVVLYGEVPKDDPYAEDYDLHFPNPPVASILPDAKKLAKLPSARAMKSHVKRYGRDLVNPNGSTEQVLKFLEGARIMGIDFPEKWRGKWCTGWHDGLWGVFSAKFVTLEPPAQRPGSKTDVDGLFITTRWKWDVKDATAGWLSFDKEETLSHVGWINQDDWCWCGMKKNGKVGLFPRSHVKFESLRESAVWYGDDDGDVSPKTTKKRGSFSLPSIKMRRLTVGSSGSDKHLSTKI
ncbi:hypothetical protein GGR54DRAFT_370040 [Hypoxylon sp. NC1633]|nr:hypothetical protein GGR54DRAFT_370040 [Hypoxylon sp. NC1633]